MADKFVTGRKLFVADPSTAMAPYECVAIVNLDPMSKASKASDLIRDLMAGRILLRQDNKKTAAERERDRSATGAGGGDCASAGAA